MTDSVPRAYLSTSIWREVSLHTVQSLMKTLNSSKVRFTWGSGSNDALIGRVRSEQASQFLFNPHLGDVMLSVDGDIQFTVEDAEKIVLRCLEGYDIIGACYATRANTRPHPAVRFERGIKLEFGPDREPVEATYASTGFMAVHRRVYEAMAKVLPLCTTGTQSEMYPFYYAHPVQQEDGSYEFLSEDWAHCYAAKELGFKVWIDPSIRVGHVGTRTYWLEDLNVTTLGNTYTITEGDQDSTGLVKDVADYLQQDVRDVVENIKNGDPVQALATEWEERFPDGQPTDQEEVDRFWSEGKATLPWMVKKDLDPVFWERVKPIMTCVGATAIVGGIGTLDVAMRGGGRDLVHVAPPSPVRDLAKFRVGRKPNPGIQGADGLSQLKDECIFHVVSDFVVDFLTHEAMREYVRESYRVLKPGGSMVVVASWDVKNTFPQRLVNWEDVDGAAREVGFIEGPIRYIKPRDAPDS